MFITFKYRDLIIVLVVFVINVIIQNYNLTRFVDISNDEGVYLYSAKLISQGHIPYKDFFLSQPAFLIYLISLLLMLVHFNIYLFHFLYILWTFSIIFPIYFLTKYLTKSVLASFFSIFLISTFVEYIKVDTRFFALRQASLSFLAFGLFFLYVKYKPKLAGILLGLFSISLISNLLITISWVISYYMGEVIFNKKIFKDIILSNRFFLINFVTICLLGYFLIFIIPQSFNNVIYYQTDRLGIPYATRFVWLIKYSLKDNWPILLLGFIGSFVINSRVKLFGLFNILTLLIVLFSGVSYYPHYLSVLGFGFSISAGVLVSKLVQFKDRLISWVAIVLLLVAISYSTLPNLKFNLIDYQSPLFFKTVQVLKKSPEPIFTFEPIYGIFSQKNLVFYYFSADMRYFRVIGTNLSNKDYIKIINQSRTILIEPFARSFIPKVIFSYINQNFYLLYNDGENQIYVKNP